MENNRNVIALANAIAYAEGWYSMHNGLEPRALWTRPYRNNNPGDLIGHGDVESDDGFRRYSTQEKGWEALYKECQIMLFGQSHIYSPVMTIEEVAGKYTETQREIWAKNVASFLHVKPETRLADWLLA